MKYCSDCNYSYNDNILYCPKCGKKLVKQKEVYSSCPYCNKKINLENSRYCSYCGRLLENAAIIGYCIGKGNSYYYAEAEGNRDYQEAVKWYEKAAKLDSPVAEYKLGWCYKYARGVIQDYEKAFDYFKQAAKQKYAAAQYEIGKWYYENEHFEEALSWLELAHRQGYELAGNKLGCCYYYLGEAYYYGDSSKSKNFTQAMKWYRKACELGDADAQFALGWCYENGQGVKQDLSTARLWYRQAKNHGVKEASDALNRIGKGDNDDDHISNTEYEVLNHYFTIKLNNINSIQLNKIKWFKNAPVFDLRVWKNGKVTGNGVALQSYELQQLNRMLADKLINKLNENDKIIVNYYLPKKIIIEELYGRIKSADNWPIEIGLVKLPVNDIKYDIRRWSAQHKHYDKGVRFGKNEFKEFIGLLHKLCLKIFVNLAPVPQPKPDTTPVIWLNKTTQEIYELGLKYEASSVGAERNLINALKCFQKAGERKHGGALCRLAYYYEHGLGGLAKDNKRALAYYKEAVDKGNADALCYLGIIYEEGKMGFRADNIIACNYYEKAKQAGSMEAGTRFYNLSDSNG